MKFCGKVYHSKRVDDKNARIARFEPSVGYAVRANYLSVMSAVSRGVMEVVKYGEDLTNTWTLIANRRAFDGVFKEGDLMWVDGESPIQEIEDEYGYGSSANAIIRSVIEVNETISVTLTRNKDQVKQ